MSAEDQDSNSRLVYSIHNSLHPNSLKYFHLDPKSGVLVLTEALDYEDIATHSLVIMVKQHGNQWECRVMYDPGHRMELNYIYIQSFNRISFQSMQSIGVASQVPALSKYILDK